MGYLFKHHSKNVEHRSCDPKKKIPYIIQLGSSIAEVTENKD